MLVPAWIEIPQDSGLHFLPFDKVQGDAELTRLALGHARETLPASEYRALVRALAYKGPGDRLRVKEPKTVRIKVVDRTKQRADRKEKIFNPEEQHRLSAYHEAGHAVFCWRYRYLMSNRHQEGVSVDGGGGGIVMMRTEVFPGVGRLRLDDPARRLMELRARQEAEISFAGPQAERRYWRSIGRHPRPIDIASELDSWESELVDWWDPESWVQAMNDNGDEPLGDLAQAARVLSEFTPREELLSALRASRERVTRLLRHPRTWAAVEAVAKELLTHGQLDPDTVEAIIDKVSPPRWRFKVPEC